ncbi:hypothetical protein D3C73_927490 [compost metagenome]
MADHETHHAGVVVFDGPGNHREAAAHLVADQVAVGTTRCRRSLAVKDAEVITVPAFAGHALAVQRSQWADLPAVVFRPIEPVVLAGCAEDLLRIFQRPVAIAIHGGIVHLRIVIGQHRLLGVQFVAANTPGAQFGVAGLDVEAPTAFALHQGDGQGPVVLAHGQGGLAFGGFFDVMLLVVLSEERLHILALRTFARDIGLPVLAQQLG